MDWKKCPKLNCFFSKRKSKIPGNLTQKKNVSTTPCFLAADPMGFTLEMNLRERRFFIDEAAVFLLPPHSFE